ncbi:site-specific integrase [Ectobacillus polymachus]|uniref:site-specific integrase n=1 Tax=Ectobacillus polymachus TaxID=1508806 RepID=UPI003A847F8D
MLLSEAREKYQLDKKIEGYSALTLKTYCFQYNLLLRFFGDIDMGEFSAEKLKSYVIEAGEHLKASSLGHRVRCIRSLFKWAYDEGFISKNPATKLKAI